MAHVELKAVGVFADIKANLSVLLCVCCPETDCEEYSMQAKALLICTS